MERKCVELTWTAPCFLGTVGGVRSIYSQYLDFNPKLEKQGSGKKQGRGLQSWICPREGCGRGSTLWWKEAHPLYMLLGVASVM